MELDCVVEVWHGSRESQGDANLFILFPLDQSKCNRSEATQGIRIQTLLDLTGIRSHQSPNSEDHSRYQASRVENDASTLFNC